MPYVGSTGLYSTSGYLPWLGWRCIIVWASEEVCLHAGDGKNVQCGVVADHLSHQPNGLESLKTAARHHGGAAKEIDAPNLPDEMTL